MANFRTFAYAIQKQYDKMAEEGELYKVEDLPVEFPDEEQTSILWAGYLKSFPQGSDPIYITNSEHDCSCCRHFVKNIGGVVSLKDGKMITVWDVEGLEHPYDSVAEFMGRLVRAQPVKTIFRSSEKRYGLGTNVQVLETGETKRWYHFEGKVNSRHYCNNPATI